MSNSVRKASVVVLDDDRTITRLVTAYINHDLGDRFDVHPFNDARQAQEWISQHGCELLISDMEMPGVNGLEMLRFVKNQNAWTQVVFMTGYSTWESVKEAFKKGASDYLLKPVSREDLLRVIDNEYCRLQRWRQAVVGTIRSTAKV